MVEMQPNLMVLKKQVKFETGDEKMSDILK